ncbi:RNA methyltransferase TrmH, group 1 [Gloeomargarita lithophora Alchichica-D10]|uniref:tRNA (cytidine/uridine-2'-O-)-methyltransferase TrmJ n=1 Tax=Gloeomargarita lithophora Alchichica-D10 TaxID=1188229 RepID=A0A1J0AFB1_9CYAN|nr:RNA methyltransferase [Gloeomargarita lithophora]APB34608.1 RNA methyltransferase TrmH, group 1 [Gloeomargarita lithophora Alchichica-D10]
MNETNLPPVRIILVEPAGELNVGAIARVMKNFAVQELILVQPRCDWLGEPARRMAVHAPEILTQARVVPDLMTALSGCTRAVTTLGRTPPGEPLKQVLPWLLAATQPVALVFGPEDRGLTWAELQLTQRRVTLPTSPEYASLNLAQAVGICLYEIYQYHQPAQAAPETMVVSPVPLEVLEAYVLDLEDLLLNVGYLHPHTRERRMAKIRNLLQRAAPSAQELALLRGMIRQIRWAISPET